MRPVLIAPLLALLLSAPAPAQTPGPAPDSFVAGGSDLPDLAAPGDVFATGARLRLRGTAGGDIHAMGFDVEVELPAPGDLYVMGGSVRVRAPVGGNLSAAGFSVETAPEAAVAGNARLSGGSVVIGGRIGGALTALGGEVRLDAAVAGDAQIAGGEIGFGPAAQVAGVLTITAPEAVAVPPTVAPPERVVYRAANEAAMMGGMGGRMGWEWDEAPHGMARAMGAGFLPMFWGALWGLGAMVGLGALVLGVLPERVERLRARTMAAPGRALLWGLGTFAALVGLVPLLALTLIGLPLAFVAALCLAAAWIAGHLVGAYALGRRAAEAAGIAAAGFWARLGALAGALGVVALVSLIPVLGWLAVLGVVFLGLGGIALSLGGPLGQARDGAETAAG